MGAWDVGSFDNDDALDWVYELEQANGFDILADAFENVTGQKEGYLEASECAVAVCAAEVVTALLGSGADDLPDEAANWVEEKPEPSEALVKMARSALIAVLDNSELKDLWEESDSYEEWQANLQDQLERLETE
ncbi:MAG TPA: DUF4259 domain-containing protein [Anaerolineales bacterium]|nr:DUF4259 domain-containing protein [Anaerolineales bacterium]